MQITRRNKAVLAGVAAITLALTACSGDSDEPGTGDTSNGDTPSASGDAPAELTTVRVGTQAGAELVYGAYYIADIMGYFADEGLENDFQSFDSGPLALTSMASGDLDAALAAWLPHVQAFAQGTDMQVVVSLVKGNTTLIGGKNVETIEDLDGKKVGSPGIGTLHDAALTLLEEQYGITTEHVTSKITNLPVMLNNGEIDAFIGWETIASQAVMDIPGAHYLERDPVPGNENLELALAGRVIKDADLAQGIVNAVYRGTKYAKACPAEFVEKIAGIMQHPDALELAQAAAPSVDATQPFLESTTAEMWFDVAVNDGKLDPSQWGGYAEFEDAIWNPTFLEAAEAEYGDWTPTC